jgi:ubiquitin carboxyl-terminal hydrolase L5
MTVKRHFSELDNDEAKKSDLLLVGGGGDSVTLSSSSRDSNGWCTIESDPGVFTELCERIGVKGIEVEEIYDLDYSLSAASGDDYSVGLQKSSPVYGLVFLFKYVSRSSQDDNDDSIMMMMSGSESQPWFARQVISNACATFAILSVLMNISDDVLKPKDVNDDSLVLGKDLVNFRDFTIGLDPEMRGWSVGNSDLIRTVHNSFGEEKFNIWFFVGRQSSLDFVRDDEADEKEDAFHFISYVFHNGRVYELDGLAPKPKIVVDHDVRNPVNQFNWQARVVPHIRSRIDKYQESGSSSSENQEIRFSLMAFVPDKRNLLKKEMNRKRCEYFYNFFYFSLMYNMLLKKISSNADKDGLLPLTVDAEYEKKMMVILVFYFSFRLMRLLVNIQPRQNPCEI